MLVVDDKVNTVVLLEKNSNEVWYIQVSEFINNLARKGHQESKKLAKTIELRQWI